MGIDPDLIFVGGVITAILSFPAMLAAWTHGESPRKGALLLLAAISLLMTASAIRPGEYSIARAPQVVSSVINSVVN